MPSQRAFTGHAVSLCWCRWIDEQARASFSAKAYRGQLRKHADSTSTCDLPPHATPRYYPRYLLLEHVRCLGVNLRIGCSRLRLCTFVIRVFLLFALWYVHIRHTCACNGLVARAQITLRGPRRTRTIFGPQHGARTDVTVSGPDWSSGYAVRSAGGAGFFSTLDSRLS